MCNVFLGNISRVVRGLRAFRWGWGLDRFLGGEWIILLTPLHFVVASPSLEWVC